VSTLDPHVDPTPMDEAAIAMHELYVSMVRAGFNRTEAIAIIAALAAKQMELENAKGETE
jgi:hypothetical protein